MQDSEISFSKLQNGKINDNVYLAAKLLPIFTPAGFEKFFDDELLNFVLDWYDYLIRNIQFSAKQPLFPRTRVFRSEETGEFCASNVEPVFWKSGGPIGAILKLRSEKAGLTYYKPHTFRHAASQLALRQCTSPEEIRAVSQNLGHENVGTTLTNYAKLTSERIGQVLGTVDFSKTDENQFDETFMRKLVLFAKVRERQLDKQDM